MMPNNQDFRKYLKEARVGKDTTVVVYDQHGMFSAPRVWFMFRVFGFTNIRVLDGGLPLWKSLKLPINTNIPKDSTTNKNELTDEELLTIKKDDDLIVDMNAVNKVAQKNLNTLKEKSSTLIIDNRSEARYRAQVKEPRENCRSGSVPSALNLPFTKVLDEKNCFKSDEELQEIFKEAMIDIEKELIWYCGSGLTACIPLLAAHIIGADRQKLYDGSWTEYGSYPEPEFSKK